MATPLFTTSDLSIIVVNGVLMNQRDASLDDQLAWLDSAIQSGRTFILELSSNFNRAAYTFPRGFSNVNIVLRGADNINRTVSLSPAGGTLFTVPAGITLTLDFVTLQGRRNSVPLVMVEDGASLVMNDGSMVTRNTNESENNNSGSGVFVMPGGLLHMMRGSSIRENVNSGGDGAGVFCQGKTIIEGGRIASNRAMNGGGIFVDENATVLHIAGSFENNSTIGAGNGGAINIAENATFDMRGGVILGNRAGIGAGVYNEGLFRISNGLVYGSNSRAELRNVATTVGSSLHNVPPGTSFAGVFNEDGLFTSYVAYVGPN